MNTWEVDTMADLSNVADAVLAALQERQTEGHATVLALHGDLGAGKTTFTQTLANKMGVQETVVSPTFVIMKFYDVTTTVWSKLVHIDAYRIEDVDEMRPLQFAELLTQKHTIICIEWAENIAELLPTDTVHLTFSLTGEHRTLTLT